MATEIELKLQLTPQTAQRLSAHPLLAGIQPQGQHLLNTYYDTPALDLNARRIGLRFRKKGRQWLLTVKSAATVSGGLALRDEWEARAKPGQFDFSHVDAPKFRAILDEALPRLQAIFTTDFRRLAWQVPFGRSRIELVLDRGKIESDGRTTAICEIELELISGDVGDVFAVARQLQETLDLRPAVASKAERGYALFNNAQEKPFRAKAAVLDAGMSPVEAFRAIALGCLEQFQRNENGLVSASEDPEYVHQARIALRRLRSAIKLFAPVLPADFVATYNLAWQNLGTALGESRNWDVFVSETMPPILADFPNDRNTLRLLTEGRRRAKRARTASAHVVGLPDYSRLIVEFTAAVYGLQDQQRQDLTKFARKRLRSRDRQARLLAERVAELTPEDRHRMRICFKKLRYAIEFFTPLLSPKRLRPNLLALTQLQDELGLINDQVTARTLVEQTLEGRTPGPVHGWIAGRHELLLRALPEALDTWLAQRLPW
ncbi:MAG: CHAD domain-containing protein [Dechloromonas sp.]|jgi:triphosphatase|nr:CHAD domain-containing protein [Dechloromonas sp.]